MTAVVELRPLVPGAWAVSLEGTRVGTVGGAASLGYQWSSSDGSHSACPRRYATRSEAVQSLVEHVRRHAVAQ